MAYISNFRVMNIVTWNQPSHCSSWLNFLCSSFQALVPVPEPESEEARPPQRPLGDGAVECCGEPVKLQRLDPQTHVLQEVDVRHVHAALQREESGHLAAITLLAYF